jgi:hypothetical protein
MMLAHSYLIVYEERAYRQQIEAAAAARDHNEQTKLRHASNIRLLIPLY